MLQAGRIASLRRPRGSCPRPPLPGVAAADDRDDDAIVVITGGATVAEGETVDEVVVVDGPVRIDGTVDGDVFVVSGDTEISEVTGDVTIIAEPAVINTGARIGGDLRYGDEEPEIASGAIIDGEVSDEDWSDLPPGRLHRLGRLLVRARASPRSRWGCSCC